MHIINSPMGGDSDYNDITEKCEVLLYTGIKDKNGIEICEGDILRGVSTNEFSKGDISDYELIWGKDSWHIKGTYMSLQELFNYCNDNIEVIGNIYENPKLKP